MECPTKSLPVLALALTIGLVTAGAQAPAFEVASVKSTRQAPRKPGLFAMDADPAMVRYANISLSNLISLAYRVDGQRIKSPSWTESETYDVAAKLPAGATRDQIPAMLQALLAERFKLVVHHQNEEQRVYFLVLGKQGSKLKKAEAPADTGVQQVRGDHPAIQALPHALSAHAIPISSLASALARPAGAPVLDHTGLAGLFDIKLTWTPDTKQGSGPSIFTAIQEQLGLKLEPGKAPIDTLVVDHAERDPIEN